MPLEIRHERLIFLTPSGAAHEVMSFDLMNTGHEDLNLEPRWIEFRFSDAPTRLLQAVCGGAEPAYDHEETVNTWTYRLGAGGVIPKGHAQRHAVLVERHGLATVGADGALAIAEASFNDQFVGADAPFVRNDVLVFPQRATHRCVEAQANRVSTRVAAFTGNAPHHRLVASCARRGAARGVALLDDMIAECYRRLASTLVDTQVAPASSQDLAVLARLTAQVLGDAAFVQELSATDEWSLREAVDTLWTVRDSVASSLPAPMSSDYILRIAETRVREVEAFLAANPTRRVPRDLGEVLLCSLRFLSSCQRDAPRWKSSTPDEEALHDALQVFFTAAELAATRELEVNNGRLDLLVQDVPMELKADTFGGDVVRLHEAHGQQAAEYAVRTEQPVGILLGLDLSPPSTVHGPQLDERIRVLPARSSTGQETPIVTILASAYQSKPSSLQTRKARLRRVATPGV